MPVIKLETLKCALFNIFDFSWYKKHVETAGAVYVIKKKFAFSLSNE